MSITGHSVAEGADQIIDFAGMPTGHQVGGADINYGVNNGISVTVPEGIVFSGGTE